jgi:membrane protease YdiL (CAAX protease family)
LKDALRLSHGAAARAGIVLALAIGIDLGRSLSGRALPGQAPTLALAGGIALCCLGFLYDPRRLGLDRSRPGLRLVGGLALAAVLLLPAAVRWTGAPPLGGPAALAAVAVALGQEIGFRGAVFAALEDVGGPVLAVGGSSLAFLAVHVLTHRPEFLPAVLGAGLLLGLWRWACQDLVAPALAHVVADLAL